MPSLVVVAGPNGSGKSTLYRNLIEKFPSLKKIPFLNPDEVAKSIFGNYLQDDSLEARRKMLSAGKESLRRRVELLESGESFGFETTLSGHSEIRTILEAKSKGYRITMVFVGLDDPGLNIMRAKLRVENGGHFVDPNDIVRRWKRSMENIKNIISEADTAYLVDNSKHGHLLIATAHRLPSGCKAHINNRMIEKDKWYTPILSQLAKHCLLDSDRTNTKGSRKLVRLGRHHVNFFS